MEITIYSYNIHSGKNLFYRRTLDEMIRYFQQNHADILLFQEVHNNDKNGWQFEQIKRALEMDGFFGGNVEISNGSYGNAVFSRFPIHSGQNILLPSEGEQRGTIHAQINMKGERIHLLNTHLGLSRKERAAQMESIEQLISKINEPTLIAGDFNTVKPEISSPFRDLGKEAGEDSRPTIFPLKKRIDFIFASKHFKLIKYEVLSLTLSDHYPLKAIVQLPQ